MLVTRRGVAMKHQETAYRLKTALDRLNMRAQELSDRSGVAKASISQYINGTHKPSNVSAGKMAAVLDVDPLWLMGFDVPMKAKTPVYEVAAGEGRMNDGYPTEEKYLVLADDERLVTVYGDSMEPTLLDGDDVVIKEQNYLSGNDNIYLVKINGYDTTLKRVRKQEDGLVLIGDNINVYAPHFYTADQVKELPVTIEGRVIRIIRDL